MGKTLFCFICKKQVDVHADAAIAALCDEHKTQENLDMLQNEIPIRQLHAAQDEGLRLWVNSNQDATKADMESILLAIEALKNKIEALPTETTIIKEVESAPTPTPETQAGGSVNEFGEII